MNIRQIPRENDVFSEAAQNPAHFDFSSCVDALSKILGVDEDWLATALMLLARIPVDRRSTTLEAIDQISNRCIDQDCHHPGKQS